MKITGIVILVCGLVLSVFALFMDTTVSVKKRDYGYGVTSPAMEVSNIDLIAKRQGFLIFSGMLSVVGAILVGFGSISKPSNSKEAEVEEGETQHDLPISGPTSSSVSICRNCHCMGAGDAVECHRCGEPFPT
ncbi:hypothetical protein [Janthinobacterium sp. CG_23.4]|uniref:hypothetical protein n=1 Tax=Janthinobacterium sp. CG_23.4 TaxID=2760707 RepID=UPI002472F945|nr:hypothetical protein [Janthinobacterium sp. CG_23.4]MDH6157405.1 hypothetical protein [Janthinobacterium sp. CG_23.4]